MSVALLLYRLQQIDSRLGQVTSRLAAIQSALDNNAELQASLKMLEAARSSQHQAEKALKDAEYESATQRVRLEQAESSLYSGNIKNPKELQDLQNDIASIKRHLAQLEDRQLETMMALENSTTEQDAAQKHYEQTQGRVISGNANLLTELASLKKESENLAHQRNAVLPQIDAQSLSAYEALRLKRAGLAVSQVVENSCDTCGSTLTPGYAQSVRTSSQLVTCPMCGRILYSN